VETARAVGTAQTLPLSRQRRSSGGPRRPAEEGGAPMRAIALYLLGVPVFVIVILWLFGVV
jgi:hypothetical protein